MREKATTSKSNSVGNKSKPSKAWRKDSSTKTKGKIEIPCNNNYDIKCFKC
jgi:hypothetical protein